MPSIPLFVRAPAHLLCMPDQTLFRVMTNNREGGIYYPVFPAAGIASTHSSRQLTTREWCWMQHQTNQKIHRSRPKYWLPVANNRKPHTDRAWWQTYWLPIPIQFPDCFFDEFLQ